MQGEKSIKIADTSVVTPPVSTAICMQKLFSQNDEIFGS